MDSKSKVTEVSAYERKLSVEVPYKAIEDEMNRQFESLTKTVKLKGFRPGNVPLQVVKQQFHTKVKGDSVSKLLDQSYAKALEEHKIFPVDHPKIELKPHKDGNPFLYEALVEIKPSIKLKKIKGLKVEKEKVVIEKKRVDETLEKLRESKAQLKAIDKPRPTKTGDNVVVDFKGAVDGKVFPGGTAQNFLYEIGSNRFVPGFDEGLVGMKLGEDKKVEVSYPKDFHEKRLAGKKVIFDVKLCEIKVKEIPKLDDAFAKEVDGCKTVSELRVKVETDLQKTEEQRVERELESALLKALVSANDFQVPPSMVKRQLEHLNEDSKRQLQQMGLQGAQLDDALKGWGKDLNERAAFDVKVVLLSEAVVQNQKLKVDEKELNAELEEVAKRAKVDVSKVRAYYKQQGAEGQFRWQLLQKKVIQWLVSQASVKQVAPKKAK